MTVQLPLPGLWPRNMSRRDPIAALEDKFEATYAIELLLGRLAEKHGNGPAVIAKALRRRHARRCLLRPRRAGAGRAR